MAVATVSRATNTRDRRTATVSVSGARLRGFDELDARLAELSEATRAEIVELGVRAGAEVLAAATRQQVRGISTTIAANIGVDVERVVGGKARARIGPTTKTIGRRTLVQALAYWFEFGTQASRKEPEILPLRYQKGAKRATRGTGPRALTVGGKVFGRVRHRGMRARPFLSVAFLRDGRRAVHVMGQTIYDELVRRAVIR